MLHRVILFALACYATACSESGTTFTNSDVQTQRHCLVESGQSYSFLKQGCVQPSQIADIKLTDPADNTLAIYVILSEDRQWAEVFATDLPRNTLLEAVKGGYLSRNSKVRLLNTANGWIIRK